MTEARTICGRTFAALIAMSLAGCDQLPGPSADAIDAVKKELADPYSAKFEDVEPCPKNPDIYRGKVNAKNRFGAFTGLTDFYVIHGNAFMESNELERLLNERGYSFVLHLAEACQYGTDPDLESYMKAVDEGTALTLSQITEETDEERRARLGLPSPVSSAGQR